MGVINSPLEFKVGVSAAWIFKTLIIESYTLLPQMLPTAIKSYDLLHGDGGPGSIAQTTFHDGAPFSHLKHRIDAVNTENFMIKYGLIEGALLGDKLESVHYEAEFEDSANGGCAIKISIAYHIKGDAELNEEDIKAIKDQALVFYTVIEQYLLAHPRVCV